ncbi:MAG: hypothetical protein M1815_001956 [Lichina confinis]|nr:MAG: hypothetical protein M1815_001956 [Lichina confinis]
MVEAEMGLMHITGPQDGPPVKVGVAVTDLTTGLYTSNAILAALIHRGKTGKGQHIDAALSDCQIATLTNIASSALVSGKGDSGRWGTAHRLISAAASIVPYKAFRTADGEILIGAGNDHLFGVLCQLLDKPEWSRDLRFTSNSSRVSNREVLEPMIEEQTTQRTTQSRAVLRYLLRTPANLVLARDMVIEVDHPTCGPIKMVNTPIKYSVANPSIRSPPPTLGQHTDEVLRDMLGMHKKDILRLKEIGAVSG